MSLMQFQRVDFSAGGPLLLEHVDLSIESGERVCIVGRNGAGKKHTAAAFSWEKTDKADALRTDAKLK